MPDTLYEITYIYKLTDVFLDIQAKIGTSRMIVRQGTLCHAVVHARIWLRVRNNAMCSPKVFTLFSTHWRVNGHIDHFTLQMCFTSHLQGKMVHMNHLQHQYAKQGGIALYMELCSSTPQYCEVARVNFEIKYFLFNSNHQQKTSHVWYYRTAWYYRTRTLKRLEAPKVARNFMRMGPRTHCAMNKTAEMRARLSKLQISRERRNRIRTDESAQFG